MKLPITILKDFSAELWISNRRKVLVDYDKRQKIDGIKIPRKPQKQTVHYSIYKYKNFYVGLTTPAIYGP